MLFDHEVDQLTRGDLCVKAILCSLVGLKTAVRQYQEGPGGPPRCQMEHRPVLAAMCYEPQ